MINFEEIAEKIYEQAMGALGAGSLLVQERARQLAPVRHIFAEDRYTIRYKQASEMEADRSVRARLGLSVEGSLDNPRPRTARYKSPLRKTEPTNRWAGKYGSKPTSKWRERRLSAAAQHLADYQAEQASRKAGGPHLATALDRRGAYEVKLALASSSRHNPRSARSLSWGHAYVGGRLRNSIRAIAPQSTGGYTEAWVVAGGDDAPYAKYQEFGTRHNAAHPFLRPALAETRGDVISRIATAIRDASRTGASMEIEIEVRL